MWKSSRSWKPWMFASCERVPNQEYRYCGREVLSTTVARPLGTCRIVLCRRTRLRLIRLAT